ncbi:putative cation-transporting ATPase F [bacterium HR26]|nr:putative cation-transporting ATPase F [bacterium HR26]
MPSDREMGPAGDACASYERKKRSGSGNRLSPLRDAEPVWTHDGSDAASPVPWHALPAEECMRRLGSSPEGLSQAEARRRLARYGPNQVEEIPPPNLLRLAFHQFTSPLIYILLVAGVVTALLGEWIDAGVIAAALLLNAAIGFMQEHQAERSLRTLMRSLAPRARILRDGQERVCDSRDLVPGDVVLLESGTRVPADLRLLTTIALQIDESLLTGESVPVVKRPEPVAPETPLADRRGMAYAGTIVTSGRGRGLVIATGRETELGKIAAVSREEVQPETPLQRQIGQFTRTLALVVLVTIVAIAVVGLARGEDPLSIFTFAVAAAVSIVPEGLPIVVTIVLAVSVQRMARRNAIIRHLPAVETLGSTTVIGTDKTGTLTENRMAVRAIWSAGEFLWLEPPGRTDAEGMPGGHNPSPPKAEQVQRVEELSPAGLTLIAGVLPNEARLMPAEDGAWGGIGDPTEVALLIAAARLGLVQEDVRALFPPVAEVPFEPERRFSAAACRSGGELYLFVKGAPERVLEMSNSWLTLHGPAPLDRDQILAAASTMGQYGLRVLAMAYRRLDHEPEDVAELLHPSGLTFLGLQGMWDPPRVGVKDAIARCRQAGIRVVMITGDHADTASAIATELGIAPAGAPVLIGTQLSALDDEQLREAVRDVDVYARVEPIHKLRIVRALQAHGEVVAVTGDGVNDAPALRAANVGIAMGRSGTDVAREAADVVLADDNFVTLAAAVEEGRGAFDNLRKATFFLVSTSAAMLVTLPAAVLLGWPLPLLPAQLLWLNVVTDSLQDVTMAFEPKEPELMRRRPRPREEGILSPVLWERMLLSGVVMAAGTLWLFDWTLETTGSLDLARTVAMTTVVIYQVFQAWNARSTTRSIFQINPLSNRYLFIANAASLAIHVAALYLPPTQFVLRVEPIALEVWWRIALVAASLLVMVELHKLVRRRWPLGSP